jgi:uncharacterized surface protein with fasciclin (FAS1) repeats
MEINKH